MKKILIIMAVVMFAALRPLGADEASPEVKGHHEFSKELIEACLSTKHGQMIRCIREGIDAVAGDDITIMDEDAAQDVTLWEAPDEALAEENPFPRDEDSVARGRAFYKLHCAQCHGVHGAGDGPAAADFGRPIAALSEEQIQERTDGELMWKITEGGWPMPAFGFLEEWSRDELWHVINYLRTLSFEER